MDGPIHTNDQRKYINLDEMWHMPPEQLGNNLIYFWSLAKLNVHLSFIAIELKY